MVDKCALLPGELFLHLSKYFTRPSKWKAALFPASHSELLFTASTLELSTNLREVFIVPGEGLCTWALSMLKAPSSTFTIKNLLRHYAKQAFKQHKFKDSLTALASTHHRTPATGAPVGNYSEGFCHFNSWEWRGLLKCVNFQATLSTKYFLPLRLWYFDIGYFMYILKLERDKTEWGKKQKNNITQMVVRWNIDLIQRKMLHNTIVWLDWTVLHNVHYYLPI